MGIPSLCHYLPGNNRVITHIKSQLYQSIDTLFISGTFLEVVLCSWYECMHFLPFNGMVAFFAI